MNKYTARPPLIPLLVLSLCLVFLGINGLVGGYLMVTDPNGTPMGMSVSDLEHTPFENYFVPGLWLIFVWGAGSFVALAGLWLRPQQLHLSMLRRLTNEHWAWILSVGLGLALLVWLTVQVFTLPHMAPPQYILYGLAIVIIGISFLPAMRQYYQLSNKTGLV
jgi:hypothetical protein